MGKGGLRDDCFDLLRMRPADDKDLLDACEGQTFECPIEERRIAHVEQTLASAVNGALSMERYSTHSRFPRRQRPKAFVEAVSKNHCLQNVVVAA